MSLVPVEDVVSALFSIIKRKTLRNRLCLVPVEDVRPGRVVESIDPQPAKTWVHMTPSTPI